MLGIPSSGWGSSHDRWLDKSPSGRNAVRIVSAGGFPESFAKRAASIESFRGIICNKFEIKTSVGFVAQRDRKRASKDI